MPQKQVNELVLDASSLNLPSAFRDYKSVSIGIGKLPIEHDIKLQDNCVPVVRPPCRIPFKIRDSMEKKLDDMEKLNLICKVTKPTEWVNRGFGVSASSSVGRIQFCDDLGYSVWPISFSSSAVRYLLGARGISSVDDAVVWRP